MAAVSLKKDAVRDGCEVGLLLAEELPDGPWSAFRAFTLQAGLYASPEYFERHGTPTTPAELAEHRLASWKYPGYDGRSLKLRAGGELATKPFFVCSYAEPLWVLVADGQAIGNLCAHAFDSDRVRPVLADHVGYEVHLWVVFARDALAVPRVRELHRLLRNTAAEIA